MFMEQLFDSIVLTVLGTILLFITGALTYSLYKLCTDE